jgi:hypothetical protein
MTAADYFTRIRDMFTNQAELTTDGVGYYNKEKQRITKNNLLVKEENKFSLSLSGSEGKPSESHGNAAPVQVESGDQVLEPPATILDEDMIERAPIQLWDNGETAFQRYKLKVRLNLRNDKTNPEFIASLTKDIRNFRKYIPAECKEAILEKAQEIRKHIKIQFGTFPYIGKFHLNQGHASKKHKTSNQIEPWTMCAVWYDSEEKGWSGVLWLHDWTCKFDLFDSNITAKQSQAGLKCSTLFINPKYDTRVRPKTWAEKRAAK